MDDSDTLTCDRQGLKIVRVLSTDDKLFTAAVELATRSFCGTTRAAPESLLDWAYTGASTMGKPLASAPTEAKTSWFFWIMRWALTKGAADGAIYVLVDGDRVVAATSLYPPNDKPKYKTSNMDFVWLFFNVGSPPPTDGAMDRLSVLEHAQHDLHGRHASEPHLYVHVFAVDSEVQGKGYGSELLGFIGRLADKWQTNAYLETAGERNKAFYTVKGGFKAVEAEPLVLKDSRYDDAGGIIAMVRATA